MILHFSPPFPPPSYQTHNPSRKTPQSSLPGGHFDSLPFPPPLPSLPHKLAHDSEGQEAHQSHPSHPSIITSLRRTGHIRKGRPVNEWRLIQDTSTAYTVQWLEEGARGRGSSAPKRGLPSWCTPRMQVCARLLQE